MDREAGEIATDNDLLALRYEEVIAHFDRNSPCHARASHHTHELVGRLVDHVFTIAHHKLLDAERVAIKISHALTATVGIYSC